MAEVARVIKNDRSICSIKSIPCNQAIFDGGNRTMLKLESSSLAQVAVITYRPVINGNPDGGGFFTGIEFIRKRRGIKIQDIGTRSIDFG